MASSTILPLLAKAKAGDAEAFTALLGPFEDRLGRLVWSSLRGSILGDSHADDIMQEIRINAWKALREGKFHYEGDQQFWGWLSLIANHCIIDLRRRHARQPSRLPELQDGQNFDFAGEAQSPRSQLAHEELAERFRHIVSQMPSKMRIVVELRMQELPHSEIGKKLGMTEGAVRTLCYRAMECLRANSGVHELCRDWSSIMLPTPG